MSIKQRTRLIWAITLIEQGEGISTKHFAFYQQLFINSFLSTVDVRQTAALRTYRH
jgi:hypothetical protein